jgi:hypothetical protein
LTGGSCLDAWKEQLRQTTKTINDRADLTLAQEAGPGIAEYLGDAFGGKKLQQQGRASDSSLSSTSLNDALASRAEQYMTNP